jgi:hypothetical protein
MASLSTQGGTVTDHAIKSALEQLQATLGEAKGLSERLADPRANSLRNVLDAADKVYTTIHERMKEIADWELHKEIDPPVRSIHADESGNIYDRVTFDARQFSPTIEQLWTPDTWGVIRELLNALPPPSSEGTESGEQQLPDPDLEIREFLKGPLPTTPNELLAECETLRHRLADAYFTISVVSSGRKIADGLWAAMRLIGGVVPPFPELAECDTHAAWDDLIATKQRFEAVNQALDTVVGWCAARGAEPKRHAVPSDQAGTRHAEGTGEINAPGIANHQTREQQLTARGIFDLAATADRDLTATDRGQDRGDATGALLNFCRGKQIELDHLELQGAGPVEYQEHMRQVYDRAWWLYRFDCPPPPCPTVATKLEAFQAIASLIAWVTTQNTQTVGAADPSPMQRAAVTQTEGDELPPPTNQGTSTSAAEADRQRRDDTTREAIRLANRQRQEASRCKREEDERIEQCRQAVQAFEEAKGNVISKVNSASWAGQSMDTDPYLPEIGARLADALSICREAGLLTRLDAFDPQQSVDHYYRPEEFGTREQASQAFDFARSSLQRAAAGSLAAEQAVKELWFDGDLWPAGKWASILLQMVVKLIVSLDKRDPQQDKETSPHSERLVETMADGGAASPGSRMPAKPDESEEDGSTLPEMARLDAPTDLAGPGEDAQCEGTAAPNRHETEAGGGQGDTEPYRVLVPTAVEEFVFARSGDGYFIKGFGESGHLSRYKGFDVIARLLRTPGQPVSMMDLTDADDRTKADRRSPQEVLDAEAKRQIKEQLTELEADLEQARANNSTVEADAAEADIMRLKQHLVQAVGLGGKDRDLNNHFNKLRSRIWNQLRTAYCRLRESNPQMKLLAEHFDMAISSEMGQFTYRPGPNSPSWITEL